MATVALAAAAASLLATSTIAQPPPLPPPSADVAAAKAWWDCAMRREALALAADLQPFRTQSELQSIADALAGAPEVPTQCRNLSVPRPAAAAATAASVADAPGAYGCKSWLYISSINGSDSAPGTQTLPLRTLSKGVAAMRTSAGAPHRCLLLRGGTFFLKETVVLDAASSGLTIAAVPGERVVISGGEPLRGSSWTPHKVSSTNWSEANIWATQLPPNTARIEALRIASKRAIRALYPNHIPELGFGSDLKATQWFPPPTPTTNLTELWPAIPLQRDSANESAICNEQQGGHGQFCQPFFQRYHLGLHGACDNFDPPAGYWCYTGDYGYKDQPTHPLGPGEGGRPIEVEGGMAGPYNYPSGLGYNQSVLPHSPYKNATTAIIHAWMSEGHWASWFFEVGGFNHTGLNFSRGGFQSARGSTRGGEFYIENVEEELDAVTEFYHNLESEQLCLPPSLPPSLRQPLSVQRLLVQEF